MKPIVLDNLKHSLLTWSRLPINQVYILKEFLESLITAHRYWQIDSLNLLNAVDKSLYLYYVEQPKAKAVPPVDWF